VRDLQGTQTVSRGFRPTATKDNDHDPKASVVQEVFSSTTLATLAKQSHHIGRGFEQPP